MSLRLLGGRVGLHLKRIWDGQDYRPTLVVRTRRGDFRLRLVPPGVFIRRF